MPKTLFNMFFVTKAHVISIFVVIDGEGHKLETFWRHPTHEWLMQPVTPFFKNLQALNSCLRLVRTLHNQWEALTNRKLFMAFVFICRCKQTQMTKRKNKR